MIHDRVDVIGSKIRCKFFGLGYIYSRKSQIGKLFCRNLFCVTWTKNHKIILKQHIELLQQPGIQQNIVVGNDPFYGRNNFLFVKNAFVQMC